MLSNSFVTDLISVFIDLKCWRVLIVLGGTFIKAKWKLRVRDGPSKVQHMSIMAPVNL